MSAMSKSVNKEAVMMKTSKLLLGLMFCMSSLPAMAIQTVAEDVRSVWGDWPKQTCLTAGADNFPTSAYIHAKADSDVSAFNGSCRRGYGRRLLVAVDVTKTGARFCPVFVYGLADGWHASTWTRYGRYGDNTNCVWMCLPGWTGENCAESSQNGSETSMYDMEDFRLDRYLGKYDGVGSSEVEPSLNGFFGQSANWCYGNNSKSESDMVLAVTGFLPSGNGAWVQQTAVTAYRYFGWGHWLSCDCNGDSSRERKRCEKHRVRIGVPNTDSAGEGMGYKGTLVCKIGFKPNPTGDDCVAINAGVFSEKGCKEAAPAYDSTKHRILEYKPKTTKNVASCLFTCQETGYALESISSGECVPCPQELRQGVSSEGVCLKCDNKHLYDSETGACVEAQMLKESDLLYGIGKAASKTTVPCWMADDLENYTKCIYSEPWDEGKKAEESGASKTSDASK